MEHFNNLVGWISSLPYYSDQLVMVLIITGLVITCRRIK